MNLTWGSKLNKRLGPSGVESGVLEEIARKVASLRTIEVLMDLISNSGQYRTSFPPLGRRSNFHALVKWYANAFSLFKFSIPALIKGALDFFVSGCEN